MLYCGFRCDVNCLGYSFRGDIPEFNIQFRVKLAFKEYDYKNDFGDWKFNDRFVRSLSAMIKANQEHHKKYGKELVDFDYIDLKQFQKSFVSRRVRYINDE